MKTKMLFILISCFCYLLPFAQVSKTVNLTAITTGSGALSEALTATEKSTVTNLTITGTINAMDFKTMRDNMTVLANVDLSGASISAYTGTGGCGGTSSQTYTANRLPNNAFFNSSQFLGKASLNSLKLPATLTQIGSFTIDECRNLKYLYLFSAVPPTFMSSSFFNSIGSQLLAIYVPVGKVETYKAAAGWSSYCSGMEWDPCKYFENALKISTPTTAAISKIGLNSAQITSSIDFIPSTVTSYGFCWNTTGSPTVDAGSTDSNVDNGVKSTTGSYSNNISGLTPGTVYAIRAYAKDATTVLYGNELIFSTAITPNSSTIDGVIPTDANGNSLSSLYLAKDKSPYSITGDVTINDNSTLTIEPGVVLNFSANKKIIVSGDIQGTGTATDSITFNANKNACTFVEFNSAKLSNSNLSFIKLKGFIGASANASLTSIGICTDSIIVNNSRIDSVQLSTGKIYLNNSTLRGIAGGATPAVLTNSSILNSNFNNLSTVNLLNSTAQNVSFNGYDYSSSVTILNSILKTCQIIAADLKINKSKIDNSTLYNQSALAMDSTLLYKSNVSTEMSYNSRQTINNCIFKVDSTHTLIFKSVAITKSAFIGNSNTMGGLGLDEVQGTITNCSFYNHRYDIQTNSSSSSNALTISGSNIVGYTKYAVSNIGPFTLPAANMGTTNYWGAGVTSLNIASKLSTKITKPTALASSQNIDSPISAPANFSKVSASGGGVTYTWSANPESDLKGYKLYYGKIDNFSYANSIDLGNVTTYTLAAAELKDPVVVTAYDLLADDKNDMVEGHESWYADIADQTPKATGKITGNATVCATGSETYTAPTYNSTPTSYIWTLPSGATGTSTTNTITVQFSKTAVSGNISVQAVNEYGNSTKVNFAVTVNPVPVKLDELSSMGGTSVAAGDRVNFRAYSYSGADMLPGVTYKWTLPTGATGSSTNGSIAVDFDNTFTGGDIRVCLVNSCGEGIEKTLTLTTKPSAAGTISGATSVIKGGTYTYTVPTITNADTYVWTLPDGATGSSTTNSIDVTFGTNVSTNASITVKGQKNGVDGNSSSIYSIEVATFSVNTMTDKNATCGSSVQFDAVTTNYSGNGTVVYKWTPATDLDNDASANPTAQVTGSREYTVEATMPDGTTKATGKVKLNRIAMPKPIIGIVGVNNSNKNIIQWNKAVSTSIDSYNIYKETNVTNVFEKIASVAYASAGSYVDDNSNPTTISNKYKISIVDACSLESDFSDTHKTMHLSINKGTGDNTWNLIWEKYEGFTVSTYNVYRGTDAQNLSLIGTTSGSNSQYTDNAAPTGYVYYQVEVISPNSISAVKSLNPSNVMKVATANFVSRSNIATNNNLTTAIATQKTPDLVSIFPNPTTSNIQIKGIEGKATLSVFGIDGRLMLNKLFVNNETISVSNLANGIYTLRIQTENGVVERKLIKK